MMANPRAEQIADEMELAEAREQLQIRNHKRQAKDAYRQLEQSLIHLRECRNLLVNCENEIGGFRERHGGTTQTTVLLGLIERTKREVNVFLAEQP
jgi:hypothetical protein